MTKENSTPSRAAPQKPVARILRGILVAISAVALSLTLVIAFAAVIVPAVTGSQSYTVLTSSMAPGFPPGTYLVVKPTPADDLKIGDIVTYQLKSGQPEVVTHRIIEISAIGDGERRFITKGDNNAVADPDEVRPQQIRGSLWYAIPYLGWATGLRKEGISSVWIPVVAGIVLLYAAYMVIAWIVERRKKRRAAHGETDEQ